MTPATRRARWCFPPRASSAAEARAATRRFLASLSPPAGSPSPPGVDEDAVVLAVSELVANAVLHADAKPGDIELRLEARGASLHVEVEDGDPRPPVIGSAVTEKDRGRGLLIVDRLAVRWGWTPVPDNGKAVWCELAAFPA